MFIVALFFVLSCTMMKLDEKRKYFWTKVATVSGFLSMAMSITIILFYMFS